MTRTLFTLTFLFLTYIALGQSKNKSFTVRYISDIIKADGILDEPVWETAENVQDFWEYFPVDSIQARKQSNIKMLYDDQNLYVGITVYTAGKDFAIESLKRDFRAGNSDNITLLFDTFNDGTNAFLFGTNPYGVRREGLVSGGGLDLRGFTISWDVKWKGTSMIYDDYYTSELIIPLTSFKFNEGETKWRFNSYRFDTQSNETSTWMRIPQNQNVFGLTFMGDMVFEKPLGKSRTPIAIIPYVNASSSEDFELDDTNTNFKVGGDVKVSIGNSMNLDITVNPDFSQVEVDDQFTNLTRFEVSLPEKRQFFLDNSDLFSDFGGSRDANPFFSRRIGIATDTAGISIENRILGGVRLSGKLNPGLRLGFFTIQTEEDRPNEIPSNNNTMLALQQKVFSRSNIGLFFINRQAFGETNFIDPNERYNRVVGVDYNLISEDNVWNGKFYTHKSFEPESSGKDFSSGTFLEFNSRNYKQFIDAIYVGENFRSDLGFIRRTDVLKVASRMELTLYPTKGKINEHNFSFFPISLWSPSRDFQNTDYEFRSSWEAKFKDQSELEVGVKNKFTFLFEDFDPTDTDGGTPLPGNQGYHYNSVELGYQSDRRKTFAYEIKSNLGRFFNGNRNSIEGRMSLRFQPKVSLSLAVNYDRIALPDPYPSADIWLVSPKIDITFSRSIFWSTLIQYTSQGNNLGINSRLQWRFAPLSDLFLVYNDNYFVDVFSPRLRSINLKLTYWLNI